MKDATKSQFFTDEKLTVDDINIRDIPTIWRIFGSVRENHEDNGPWEYITFLTSLENNYFEGIDLDLDKSRITMANKLDYEKAANCLEKEMGYPYGTNSEEVLKRDAKIYRELIRG